MKTAFWMAASVTGWVFFGVPGGVAAQEPLPVSGYRLVWSDEFDGKTLNTSEWDYRTDSKHWSTQTAQNVSVTNGRLTIQGKKEAAGGKQYTGGGVISKRAFQYGYYEARLRVPSGAGWHTSFWMMKHDCSGGTSPQAAAQELDVCENDSVNRRGYQVVVHRWLGPHQTFGGKWVATPDLSADFHVFGCEFTPTTVTYFFDGKLVQTIDATQFPHSDQQIWLTSIASQLGGTKAVDDSKLPATAEFDYVRFYQKQRSRGQGDSEETKQH